MSTTAKKLLLFRRAQTGVEMGGYLALADGAANLGGANPALYFIGNNNETRIRQTGMMRGVQFRTITKLAAVTAFYVQVWRKDGATWDLVGQREIWNRVKAGLNTIYFDNPLAVQVGDYLGFGIATPDSTYFLRATTGVGAASTYYVNAVPTAADYAWDTKTAATFVFPLKALGDPPMVIGIGDSLMAGHHTHYSYIENSTTDVPTCQILYQLSALNGWSYQNMGIGSQTTAQIAARITTDVVNLRPRYTILEGGVNDIALSVSQSTFIANYTTMLTACVNAGICPIVCLIAPWTNGTNANLQTRDTWNAALAALCAASYPTAIVVNLDTALGQNRAGGDPGNLWDIKTAYDEGDGVHYNTDGYTAWAAAIAAAL